MFVSHAPTAAPTATNPICPSDTWPAQPVSTTSEIPTMAKTTTVAALN